MLAMRPVCTVFASTARPWRSLYAYACCYLLPLSSALHPTPERTHTFSSMTFLTASHCSRLGQRLDGRRGKDRSRTSTGSGSGTSHARSLRPTASRHIAGRNRCELAMSTPLLRKGSSAWSRSRWTSFGRDTSTRGSGVLSWVLQRGLAGGPRLRRSRVAVRMGKGLERKKAKKSQVKSGGKGSLASPATTSTSVTTPMPHLDLQKMSGAEEFLEAFELFRKAKAPRKVVQAFEAAKKRGVSGLADLASAAVKAELKLSREDLARTVIVSLGTEAWDTWLASELDGAQAVVRCACAASEPVLAEEVVVKAGFSCGNGGDLSGDYAEAAASVYPNLITAFSRKGSRDNAMRLLEAMARARLPVKTAAMNRLLQGFHKRRDLEAVFKVLDAMAAGGVDGDDVTYEWLANAAVRTVDFVTGAVSMATLPTQPFLPEAAFIGRSNVGKSSLINMVCNRKALAYTSKTPGKTQQFNYFLMNGNTENAFYLVDMPGMGYAKVPEKQRKEWSTLFRSYITRRASLRVMFHLIDGRHGPVGQDHTIMELMRDLRESARYVVVLTKADKSDGSVSKHVLEGVITALREAGLPRTPVLLTSAASKLGRDGMWRYLRLAALDNTIRDRQSSPASDGARGREGRDASTTNAATAAAGQKGSRAGHERRHRRRDQEQGHKQTQDEMGLPAVR